MSRLNANLAVVKQRFPAVYRQLITADKTPRQGKVASDSPFAILHQGTKLYPYGVTDTEALLQRWMHGITLKPDTLYGLTGFGDGAHLEALLKESPSSSCFLVAEASPATLLRVFAYKDCTRILKEPRVFLGVGLCDQNFFKILGDISLGEIKALEPLIYAPLFALHASHYEQFFVQLAHNFDAYLHNHMSAIRSSGFHQEQCLRNLPSLIHAPDIGATTGCFKGHSLILVGAGPSLDESIDFLKQARKHAIIVSVNSSHRKLINSGITPDVTVAADPRIFTYRGYENVDTEGVYLFCPFFVSPPVIEKFKGRIFTWAINQRTIDVFKQRAQMPPPTPIAELGTISSCVVDIAMRWGCKKVCLVGQDFAIREDGQSHTEDSFYADMQHNTKNTETCRRRPGNTLEQVFVDDQLFVYLKTFEQLVEDYSELEFINTARLGAAVKGIPYYQPEAALQWLQPGVAPDVGKQLQQIIDQHQAHHALQPEVCSRIVEPSIAFAEQLLEYTLEGALYFETLPTSYASNSYRKHTNVKKALSYADKVNHLIDCHPADYAILFDGEAKNHLTQFVAKKKEIHCDTRHWQAMCENYEYFWALAESARFMLTRLKRLKDSISFLQNTPS